MFFFRLEREIENVNAFYRQKEEEFSLRLQTLLDRKRVIQVRLNSSYKTITSFVGLVEGFQQFDNDLNKLQQFVEINETAISKILKKWDKTSKSKTRALYLQRAVEIQPCFNREVLRDLSDRATTARLELEAWAEGDNVQYESVKTDRVIGQRVGTEESDIDIQVLQAAVSGNIASLREWLSRLGNSPNARDRFTRIFLASISDSGDESLAVLLESGFIDIDAEDDVNERNCLHEAAIYGKQYVLEHAIRNGVDVARADVYGRIPLHYACLKGRVEMSQTLLEAGPTTVDVKDHDNFTALIHSIIRKRISCVQQLLAHHAKIDPDSEGDHIPLNLACQHQSTEVAQLLLERRAKLLPDAEGLFPQHLAARSSNSAELLSLLMRHGADLDQKDRLYQWTPLFHAASEGRVECLRFLLSNAVDVDALDEKGLTAMYYATWEGNIECMDLLWGRTSQKVLLQSPTRRSISHQQIAMDYQPPPPTEGDGIPDLALPPPIIPLRRYGHNFLESKTYVSITFNRGPQSIRFFNEARYPAARITISSKTSDLIPRNIILPIQDESRYVSFQIDQLATFSVDFEIFPTFGSKVFAKSVALPDIFSAIESSSGSCVLPLFDPRLRSVGQIQFNFQVIKPYPGIPLEITQFATYWKSTSALDDQSGIVTGSSLSGEYLQLIVQLTRDAVPIIYPNYKMLHGGIEIPISQLNYGQIVQLGLQADISSDRGLSLPSLAQLHGSLLGSMQRLEDVLTALPANINLNIHVLYPSTTEELQLGLTPMLNINTYADAIIAQVFDHARAFKVQNPEFNRSIVFSSRNSNLCAAINWKQPNYPVLLVNDIAHLPTPATEIVPKSVWSHMSIKESARIAQSNNLMGIVCSLGVLNMVPALIDSIKALGLILVSDSMGHATAEPGAGSVPDGVNGVVHDNGILTFQPSIDM